MIVLDEQLLGRGLEAAIARWYRGKVVFITDLRPGTVIKDDAVPVVLKQVRQPTFLTINEHDFWQRVAIDPAFCVVCFAMADSKSGSLSLLLRRLLRHPEFQSKTDRMGRVVRVTESHASYYSWSDRTIRRVIP